MCRRCDPRPPRRWRAPWPRSRQHRLRRPRSALCQQSARAFNSTVLTSANGGLTPTVRRKCRRQGAALSLAGVSLCAGSGPDPFLDGVRERSQPRERCARNPALRCARNLRTDISSSPARWPCVGHFPGNYPDIQGQNTRLAAFPWPRRNRNFRFPRASKWRFEV